jgi:hypothetical protein
MKEISKVRNHTWRRSTGLLKQSHHGERLAFEYSGKVADTNRGET